MPTPPSPARAADGVPLPRLGVSACLLGERVRYDGGHKRDAFIAGELSHFVELLPVCPEVGIGLGAPREPIGLTAAPGGEPRARGLRSGRDHTAALRNFAEERLAGFSDLCGYVFKGRSPSCGLADVPVQRDGGDASSATTGIYAATLRAALPWLPAAEEGRLGDPLVRDQFLIRVFTLHRFRQALAREPPGASLVAFHTDHKYLLLAHNAAAYRRLGRLVAQAGRAPDAGRLHAYRSGLMAALARISGPRQHLNVLQHLAGHLRRRLDPGERAELARRIESFGAGRLPLPTVRALLLQHFRRHPDAFALRQVYFEPYPDKLAAAASADPHNPARWARVAPRSASSR